MKKIFITVTFLFLAFSISAQVEKLNNYKYAIVDNKFSFLKKTDQYQTSSLTKFLVSKTGIPTFLKGEEIPLEFMSEGCKGIYVTVNDNSSLLKTKNRIEFKDCSGETIFNTAYGITSEKEYRKSYLKAIRNAFKSISSYVYVYKEKTDNPKKNPIVDTSFKVDKERKTVDKVKEILYAQPKENGFQVVNAKPEVVFFLFKTEKEDVFIIKDKNGLLYKKGDTWLAETYENGKKVIKDYHIKF